MWKSTALVLTLFLSTLARCEDGPLQINEVDLREYDGTDPSKPIYLAVDGKIFDVSASPAFYGPGGHYHHFTGRDASRAWVSECWDDKEQITWRTEDLEKMFLPKYLDEELEKASAGGEMDLDLGGMMSGEIIGALAKASMERLGSVTDSEKEERRRLDAVEAKQKVFDTLERWSSFFENNPKYKFVGSVVFDPDGTPEAPPLCKKALEKRPIKGGKLDMLVDVANMAKKADGGEMPDMVKSMLAQNSPEADADRAKDEL